MTRRTDRRTFLKQAGASAAAVLATSARATRSRAAQPNEGIVFGMMGNGGRGTWLLREELLKRPDLRIAWLCDVDRKRLAAAANLVEQLTEHRPQTTDDFRRILDDRSVDVFFNVTPDHWHALPTISACQAGKDVYVEKPASHNIWEGRKMVEAARKYERVVQLGTQTRSGPYTLDAVRFLREGKIGDIHFVRVLNMKNRPPIEPKPDGEAPEGVDYEKWLGPAPLRRFNPNRFHYSWHWFWDYSGGDIINDGVHQIDAARMLIGRDFAHTVSCTGGKLAWHDAQETPDTQIVTWEFGDDLIMTFELTLWTPHMHKTPWDFRDTDGLPDWNFNATQIEIHGTKGLMRFGRHGGGWIAWNPDHEEIARGPGRHPHGPHIDNFLDCVRTRKRPNADIEEGHRSTLLCHLGNISYRCGQRKLRFDPATETFKGDSEANELVKRTYRSPWIIPDQV
jgi:predicted dehydrogenase